MPQSDFYAMGRTLIYLLTAKLPNDPSIYDSRTNAFRWREEAPQISPALADFVDELIAPAAAQRPQTTTAILERLAQVRAAQSTQIPRRGAKGRKGHHQPLLWAETTLTPHNVPTQPDPARSLLPPWLDQRPWLLAGLTCLALAIPLVGYALVRRLAPPPGYTNVTPGVENLTVAPVTALAGHTSDIYDLLLLRDGRTLVTASADETVRLWNLDTGALLRTLDQHTNVVKALAVSPDQAILVTTGDDRSLRFWALPDGQPLGTINNAHTIPMTALEVSNNGRILASADGGGSIKLWALIDDQGSLNLASMTEDGPTHTLQADGTINDFRFTRDDGFLASGGEDFSFGILTICAATPRPPSQPPLI